MATTAKVEAGAAGHGAEPRGKRTDDGQATYLIAIAEALWEEMERDERVYMLGEDIGVYGGAFKVTEGFLDRFGGNRVIDTPIAEETIVGMAVGSAMEGLRPVAEFQYADFMSSGFDSISTVLGRYHYRSGVPLPVVLRGPSGGYVRASSFHSVNPEPWFAYGGGIKIVAPAFPADAKGLMKSAVRDDNPVLYLEHKWIYRRIKEQVPTDPDFLVPIGKADVKRARDRRLDRHVRRHGAQVARGGREPRPAGHLRRGRRPPDRAPDRRGDRAELDREDVARVGRERELPVRRHRRRGRGDDRREGVRAPRRAGDAPLAAEHARAVLPHARGRVPAAGGRHRAAVEELSAW